MGNAGSSGPPRERQYHKSGDTAPSSPMRDGQAFVFDKKPEGRPFHSLHGSQDDDEPYGTPGQPLELALEPPRPRAATVSEGTTTKAANLTGTDSEKVLPTVFRWEGGGKQVYISGTFSEWKALPMVRSHGDFVTIIDLPEGEYQYKFYVDGEWRHDPSLHIVDNGMGSKNNLVAVKKSDFEVFQALDKDSESKTNDAAKEYTQDIPQNKPWEKVSGPPILPPHLLQVILNKDTPLSVSTPIALIIRGVLDFGWQREFNTPRFICAGCTTNTHNKGCGLFSANQLYSPNQITSC